MAERGKRKSVIFGKKDGCDLDLLADNLQEKRMTMLGASDQVIVFA